MTNATATIYATSITILWSESGHAGLVDGAVYVTDWAGSAWSKVESVMRAASLDAPDTGAYDKTKFVITWSNGNTYEGRIDLVRANAEGTPLADHVLSFVSHIAEMTPGANAYKLDADAIAGWATMLATHIIGSDLPAEVEAQCFEDYKARVRAEVESEIGNAPTLATSYDLAPIIAGPARAVARQVSADGERFAFLLGIE